MNEQTIFTAVLDLDPTERAAFLDGACESNYQLRERVEKLLQFHADAGDFSIGPAERLALPSISPLPSSPAS